MLSCERLTKTEIAVTHAKTRGGEEPAPFVVSLKGLAPGPVALTMMTLAQRRARDAAEAQGRKAAALVHHARKTPGLSQNALVAAAGGNKATRIEQVAELVERGVLVRRDGGYFAAPLGDSPLAESGEEIPLGAPSKKR
jgi:hypothetical protein